MDVRTHYTRAGDLNIAYQVVGGGAIDIVVIDQWFGNMDQQWEFPPLARLLERIAGFGRLILFDKRGTGLSDPVSLREQPSLEEWMDDLSAVLGAVGSSRAAIVGCIAGGYLAMLYAASFPERVSSLVLVDAYPRGARADDYPCGLDMLVLSGNLRSIEERWGEGVLLDFLGPGIAGDRELRRDWSRYERSSASPRSAIAMIRMMYDSDVRDVLPAIRVPTLVVHHEDAPRIPICHGEYLAAHIPGARLARIPGADNFLWAGDQTEMVGVIQEFVTGQRATAEPDRLLATVLFTDIVGSTDLAARIGDHRWRELLQEHHAIVRAELKRYRGREIDTAGDGFLATFDGPARGIRCALAIGAALRSLNLEIRAGLHTGEIELMGESIGGIAVHIAARVSALAAAGEVLVTRTVTELVAGSGVTFEDRGDRELKGVPSRWQLFAVTGA
jgi:class 3 adenylate cyclase/pimeloyl-ACP methyl ester carboxylesterase